MRTADKAGPKRGLSHGEQLAVSSISVWEIAMLVSQKRIELTVDFPVWIARVEALPMLTFIPVDNAIAVRSVHLQDFPHRDPADRIIVATALALGATVITADSRMRSYRLLKSTWD